MKDINHWCSYIDPEDVYECGYEAVIMVGQSWRCDDHIEMCRCGERRDQHHRHHGQLSCDWCPCCQYSEEIPLD